MRKLFGTDGIRGKADTYPMTEIMAAKIGFAIAAFFSKGKTSSKILMGRDTRESGEKIEKAVISGISRHKSKAYLSGVIPTPGISYLVNTNDFDAGIVISASHNPYYDNGIKIFNANGHKLSDKEEAEIENAILDSEIPDLQQFKENHTNFTDYRNSSGMYMSYLKSCIDPSVSLKGVRLIIDCANGATYSIAPKVFTDLGMEVDVMFDAPDGKNINANCGSEYPETMRQHVIHKKSDMGIAFDGDGDRLIICDETGDIVSGDQIIAMFACYLKDQGRLNNNSVVSTIMSNMGLGAALQGMGIDHFMTDVGDRYVAEKMMETGAILGGEDSGHIILLEKQKTGDGLVAALMILEMMINQKKPLSALRKIMDIYPQILINVDVTHKPDLNEFPDIMSEIQCAENELGTQGRVLVRYSGTQSICRVMVEGADKNKTYTLCHQIADIIQKKIGF